jgi:stage II sporulation protein D
MRCFLVSVLIIFSIDTYSQKINISLFNDYSVTSFVISIVKGSYSLRQNGQEIQNLNKHENMYVSLVGNAISVNIKGEANQTYSHLSFISGGDSEIRIRPVNPVLKPRTYIDNISVSVDFNRLLIINQLTFNEYLAGVVEAEGGPSSFPEYYKAQALLCRTYAAANKNRHMEESFNLCDGTHCQAFKGIATKSQIIYDAVKKTDGLIVVDNEKKLITAAYHSNSGGFTQDATNVWLVDLPYLQSFKDPYSLVGRNSKWQKIINRKQWQNYFSEYMPHNSVPDNFTRIIDGREKYYSIGNLKVPYTRIRKDWNLRSSFFSVYDSGTSILIKGRGYGHGVGMSQEGAMEMANQGHSFSEIIHFYFKNVTIKQMEIQPFE